MKTNRTLLIACACLLVSACKIAIDTPTSGGVTTTSGAIDCAAGQACEVHVSDVYFDETFEAVPAEGFVFTGWKKVTGGLCGGSTDDCRIDSSIAEGNEALTALLEDPEATFYLRPGFQSTGFNALFIGHSFFRPFADGMPEHAERAGIPEHTQTVVFSGGATGAPEALWNNPQKSAAIKAVLDGGDVELFGMTYHPDYPGFRGYRLWFDYALSKNPDTRLFIALPWLTQPESYDAATYDALWREFQGGDYHDAIRLARSLYPGVEIFSIPYGQAALELRNLFAAGNLPDVDILTSKTGDAIFRDPLGHADDILIELGRLVWLGAIYDVDIATYDYDTGYEVDLKAIAQSIIDGHDPEFDAPFR